MFDVDKMNLNRATPSDRGPNVVSFWRQASVILLKESPELSRVGVGIRSAIGLVKENAS